MQVYSDATQANSKWCQIKVVTKRVGESRRQAEETQTSTDKLIE